MSQTQTPTTFRAGHYETIDYTPAANAQVYGGDVIVINGGVYIAPKDIPDPAGVMALDGTHVGALASDKGRWVGPKISGEGFAVNDDVYWKSNGNPVGGTAGSGAFTRVASGNTLAGKCTKAAAAADATVEFHLGAPGAANS